MQERAYKGPKASGKAAETAARKAAQRQNDRSNSRQKGDYRDSQNQRSKGGADKNAGQGKARSYDDRGGKDRGGNERFDRKNRPERSERPAGDYIEGRHGVLEALSAGTKLKRILLAEGVESDAALEALLKKAQKANIPVQTVKRSFLDARSVRGSHQGVMAEAAPFVYASLDDLIQKAEGQENALIIIADHITDVGNLGAIVRTAEVVGAVGVLIPNKRCAQVTAAAAKTSAGATNHLPIAREASLTGSIKRLKAQGFWIAGATEHAETIIWDAPLEGRLVLVMGSEDEGISRLVQEHCDFLVKLPQVGRIESLNVAQATTAVAYEWLRRCSGK